MKNAPKLSPTPPPSSDVLNEGLSASQLTAYAVIDGAAGLDTSSVVVYVVIEDGEKPPAASSLPR